MPFEITEITSLEDWKECFPALVASLDDPYFPYWELLRGSSDDECAARFWHIHEAMPNSKWIKAWDPATGDVAGVANWLTNETDPYESMVVVPRAGWWPADDPRRDIANQMMQQFYLSRPARQSRPHILLNIMGIAPQHRRKGAGKQLMDWGTRKADELGIESFVEGTPLGEQLYATCGFVTVGAVDLQAKNPTGSKAWDEAYQKISPNGDRAVIMWRPKGGKFVKGETKYSWETN